MLLRPELQSSGLEQNLFSTGKSPTETYHQQVGPYKSLFYKSKTVGNGSVFITFDRANAGLAAISNHVSALFVAGKDRIFVPAESIIQQNQLIVWSKLVKEPVAVRYAFDNALIGNLFGEGGLPVAPFRTDDWPIAAGLQ